MSSNLEFLDPSQWEPHAVFRESFLCLRLPEELADLARHLGWHLYREALQRLHSPQAELAAPLQRALIAHARDLRQQEGALQVLGSGGELDPRARHRAQMARHVASCLSRLATTLEAASR